MDKAVTLRYTRFPYIGLCGAAALIMALQTLAPLTPFSRRLLVVAGSALLVYFVSALVLRRYQESLAQLPGTTAWNLADRACRYASQNHFALTICALVPSILLLYGSSLSFSFVGDDFGHLSLFHTYKLKVFSPLVYRGIYHHYFPVTILLLGAPSLFVGFRPFLFHAEGLLIHLLNCLMVYWLCYRTTRNRLVSLAGCALFFAYFFNYETVFWVSGIFYSGMTLFSLATFLCFVRYLEEPRTLFYVGFILFFSLAIFSLEPASVLLLLCPIYEFLHRPSRHAGPTTVLAKARESTRQLRKYILPALIVSLDVGIKPLYGIPLTNMYMGSSKPYLLKQLLFSTFYLMVPNNVMGIRPFDLTSADLFLAAALFGALIVYVFLKGSIYLRFFFLWGLITMSLTEVMTAGMAARYFYLPAAGFFPFLALLLYDLCRWAGRLLSNHAFGKDARSSRPQIRSVVRLAENSVFVLLMCIIVLKGATFIKSKEVEWRKISTIVTNIFSDIERLFPEPPLDKEVYFVNIPGYLEPGTDSPAFLYRSGFITALHIMRGEPFARKVHFSHTRDHFYPVLGSETPAVSYGELRELSLRPDVVVVLFDPQTDSLVRL